MLKPQLTQYDIFPDVLAFSTTRHGGCSTGTYGEMNINRYCGDDDIAVARNTEALAQEIGVDKARIIMPHQTHGIEIMQIAPDFLGLPQSVKDMILEGVDGVMTDIKDLCIGVSTADCIPIIIYDPDHHCAAAVHAGWRGTVKSIALKAVRAMQVSYKSKPETLTAVIGPGISMEAFEVGDEVYNEFAAAHFDMEAISCRKDKWHIDLPACNRDQLIMAGLKENNIQMSGICTYTHSDDYFSARKLGKDSGRIFTGVMLK